MLVLAGFNMFHNLTIYKIVPLYSRSPTLLSQNMQDVEEILEQIKPTPTLVFGSLLVGH
jgi:hypothetical protein